MSEPNEKCPEKQYQFRTNVLIHFSPSKITDNGPQFYCHEYTQYRFTIVTLPQPRKRESQVRSQNRKDHTKEILSWRPIPCLTGIQKYSATRIHLFTSTEINVKEAARHNPNSSKPITTTTGITHCSGARHRNKNSKVKTTLRQESILPSERILARRHHWAWSTIITDKSATHELIQNMMSTIQRQTSNQYQKQQYQKYQKRYQKYRP